MTASAARGSAAGAAGSEVNINVQVVVQSDGQAKSETSTTGTDQATAKALGERMAAVTRDTMITELRPNGLLWKLKNGQA